MKRLFLRRSRYGPKVALLLALTLVCGTSAFASTINITIPDGQGFVEDQETEPGTESGVYRPWDLEGMFLSTGNILSIVGEFPFAGGIDGYVSGDIFLDVNPTGNSDYSNGTGAFYDYVIDITENDDYSTGLDSSWTYTVYAIAGQTVGNGLLGVVGGPTTGVNPYRNTQTGSIADGAAVATGTFSLTSYANAAALNAGAGLPTSFSDMYFGGGYDAGNQYVLSGFDLDFLDPSTTSSLFMHYTYECGNDLLTGQINAFTPNDPVAEPTSMLVLGIGLLGAAAAKRGAKRLIA